MTIYYAFRVIDRDRIEIELTPNKHAPITKRPNCERMYSFYAATPEEANSIHNLRMGWGPYKPMGKAMKCGICDSQCWLLGSGECWKCNEKNVLVIHYSRDPYFGEHRARLEPLVKEMWGDPVPSDAIVDVGTLAKTLLKIAERFPDTEAGKLAIAALTKEL